MLEIIDAVLNIVIFIMICGINVDAGKIAKAQKEQLQYIRMDRGLNPKNGKPIKG